jgi:putative MATE family efflux protein
VSPYSAAPARAIDAPQPAPAPAAPAMDARTRRLLESPIFGILVRLALPNVVVMLAQSATGLIETYFIGRLGTDALAGVSLVFPAVMLMQMMSAGAMGGGISSSVARTLGAGRRADANDLVLHALIISAVFAVVFMVALLPGGPWLYRTMGGSGASLAAALTYSNVVFIGAILIWVFNGLANVLRGTGNMIVPATVSCVGAVVLVPLSPCLIFGWGPLPRLGIAGGAYALLAYYVAGSAVLAAYLWSGRGVLRPRLLGVAVRWSLFREILRVGIVAAFSTIQTNLTVAITTGLIGSFGTAAIAGYGIGSRLEYLLVPLVFGLGAPLVALVGTSVGAGQHRRALHVGWAGAGIAFVLTEAVGVAAAIWPAAWLSLFDTDPAMLAAGSAYLREVGPAYGLYGLGMALYFASQGAGRLLWPVLAGTVRLLIATGGGYALLRWTGQLDHIFYALAAALVAFGAVNAAAVLAGAWFRGRS